MTYQRFIHCHIALRLLHNLFEVARIGWDSPADCAVLKENMVPLWDMCLYLIVIQFIGCISVHCVCIVWVNPQ